MDRDETEVTVDGVVRMVLEKITLEEGDVLIVKVNDEACPEWTAEQFIKADVKCPVVVVSKDTDVQKMPEELKRQIAMIAAGDEEGLALNEWEPVGGH